MRIDPDTLDVLRELGQKRREAREAAKEAGCLRGWTGSEIDNAYGSTDASLRLARGRPRHSRSHYDGLASPSLSPSLILES